jgi:hypothetical protein
VKVKPTKTLAQKIADELFLSCNGKEAYRLALVDREGHQMSGWGKLPAIERIQMVIDNHTTQTKGHQ